MALKVGFIGCGGMNKSHMNRVKAIRGCEIVALCDVVKARAEETAEDFGGAAFTDHKAMISDVDMDACFIAMPPFANS